MSLLTEEQIKKLKEANLKFPYVNEDCIGCSACVVISEEVFELDDEGLSKVKACNNYNDKSVDEAISACPVDAISWKN
ncbi:ferredoxin [Candidatus Gracilibacteria bacterium]|nr:MAG: ferredoxin [Candidatus Gracilibacteria bacterium]